MYYVIYFGLLYFRILPCIFLNVFIKEKDVSNFRVKLSADTYYSSSSFIRHIFAMISYPWIIFTSSYQCSKVDLIIISRFLPKKTSSSYLLNSFLMSKYPVFYFSVSDYRYTFSGGLVFWYSVDNMWMQLQIHMFVQL